MARTQPYPVCNFLVEWGGTSMGFAEIDGLSSEIETVAYREGSSKTLSPVKIASLSKVSDVTLKRRTRGRLPNCINGLTYSAAASILRVTLSSHCSMKRTSRSCVGFSRPAVPGESAGRDWALIPARSRLKNSSSVAND